MNALVLALSIAATPPDAAPAPAPAAPAIEQAAPAAPDGTALAPAVALPPAASAPEPAALAPASTPTLVSALPAASALAALAAVALLLSRRRGGLSRRLVQVVESASLGPKRQLLVARMGDQLLLLGSSEAGITLLSSRPAAELEASPVPAGPPAPPETDAPAPPSRPVAAVASLIGRLRRGSAPPEPSPSFDAMLQETFDDLELRRKLARGIGGRVA